MVDVFCSGTLPHPQKTAPKTRHPKNWKGGASMPRSFMLYQVVEGRAALLEICIGAV